MSLLPINAIDSKMFFYLSSAPDYRRKSLDRSLFLVSNTYQKSWFSYYSALRQRNSSLKRNSPQEAISWTTSKNVLCTNEHQSTKRDKH